MTMKIIATLACAVAALSAAPSLAAAVPAEAAAEVPAKVPAEVPAKVMEGGRIVALVRHAAGRYTPPLAHKPRLPPIYDNFAMFYPKGVYNAGEGASLSGPVNLHGQHWLAAAFTPTASATVKEVDVAAGYIGGTNRVKIHLYADASGVPGQEVWARQATLPVFGNCCAVVALGDPEQVTLKAGTQYWIGITTLPNSGSFNGAWDVNTVDQVDPGLAAQDTGAGWVAGSSLPQFAFGVYGQ